MTAERAGKGEMGGFTRRVQTAWPSLSSALETPWLPLSGPLLSSHARTARLKKRSSCPAWHPFPAMTIASSLMGGCGLSQKNNKYDTRSISYKELPNEEYL